MSDRIFLISDDETLKPMAFAPYGKEEVLQKLLAEYPDLLAGEQVNPDDPRRWLLIRREAGVSHTGDDARNWRLDHLFLDQDGVPTLVETKIAENPELRRTVVGQMLDYASNINEAWSLERIQNEFENTCRKMEDDPHSVLKAHLASDEHGGDFLGEHTVETFWTAVKTNLEAGRLRLVFVADRIPSSLLQIVEFLNGQMDPCEVIAIELRQFLQQQGESENPIRTLVPRVLGMTATARQRKKVARTQYDPGKYILEPVADMVCTEFGMTSYTNSFRNGWVRFKSSEDDKGWLIYQSRRDKAIYVSYDHYNGPMDDGRFESIFESLGQKPLPETVELDDWRSNRPDARAVMIRIPGFLFDDDTNWDELRTLMMACLRIMLPVVKAA